MKNYARLDENNVVIYLTTAGDYWLTDPERVPADGNWIAEDMPTHKNRPALGFTYDSGRNAFIPPKPYASWTLNEDTCVWEPPVPQPDVRGLIWNESTQSWEEQ